VQIGAGGDAQHPVNPLLKQIFAGKSPASLAEVAERYEQAFASIDHHWKDALEAAERAHGPAPAALPDAAEEELRQVLYGPSAPSSVPDAQFARLLNQTERNNLLALQGKVDQLKATSPAAPARAMALVDAPQPVTPHVFLRGNPNNLGPEVPRHFLSVIDGPNPTPFTNGSGRLELAEAIASPDNPLTARVMVNRVWLHHFGAGLVRTPSDFGMRSDPPTHPELLDWLASAFGARRSALGVRSPDPKTERRTPNAAPALGWHLKALHRLIMLSAVYQQRSSGEARSAKVDPENRLLWKMNRQRLDFEALRDSLLAVSGELNLAMGGPSDEMTTAPFTHRRSVYGFIDRQNLPNLLRAFDFASPDTTSPQRFQTTVPQQALFMMNSPFVIDQAKHLVERPEVAAISDPAKRIQELYRLLYGRAPAPDEVQLGLRYLKAAERAPTAVSQPAPVTSEHLTPWEKYAQVLLMANEFVLVD
jgi:hypothetical protein